MNKKETKDTTSSTPHRQQQQSELSKYELLPLDIHFQYFNFFSLQQLFTFRAISPLLRDLIDEFLRFYFKSGPQMVGFLNEFDRKGCHGAPMPKVSFVIDQKTESNFHYRATYYGDEQDLEIGEYLACLFEIGRSEIHLSCDSWVTVKLNRVFDNNEGFLDKYFSTIFPHDIWPGCDVPCLNEDDEEGGGCLKLCKGIGGFQVQISPEYDEEYVFKEDKICYRLVKADLDMWLEVNEIPVIERPKFKLIRRGESFPHAFELYIDGMEISLAELGKLMLPKNDALQGWFDRVVMKLK